MTAVTFKLGREVIVRFASGTTTVVATAAGLGHGGMIKGGRCPRQCRMAAVAFRGSDQVIHRLACRG